MSIPSPDAYRRREVLIILSTVMVMVAMGMSIMVPVLPLYAQSFGVTSAMVGMVIASFSLARILMDIPSGHWSEKLGRRPLIIAGPAVFTVASLLCGLAPNFWMLILFRFVQGIGSAIYTTTAMTVLTDISTREDRGRVMSLYQGTLIFGTSIGPAVGGFVAQGYGLQAPFYLSTLLGLVATVWALLRIPETRAVAPAVEPGVRAPGKTLAVGGLRPLLLNANFLLVGLIGFSIHFTATGSQQTIIPLLGHNALGLGEVQIGLALAIVSIIECLVIFFGGMAADRFGRKAVILPTTVVTALSLVLFAQGDSYAFYLFSAGILGMGRGLAETAPMALAADIGHEGTHGVVSGLYRALCDAGMMLGPVILGWIADNASYGTALFINAAMLLAVALFFGTLARETTRRLEPAMAEAEG